MDKKERHIADGLKTLAGKYAPDTIVYGNVLTVDEDNRLCNVITDDDVQINDVLLQSEEAAAIDFFILPAVNSRVIMASINNSDDWLVLKCGAIQKVLINCNDIEFNGATLGGMCKRDGVKQQLNNLENDVNNLKSAFTSWVVAPNDGGAALKATTSTWAGSNLVTTVDSDIENTNIKQ
jgi:hypothetical protein